MTIMGGKLGGGPTDRSPDVLWIRTGALFSVAVALLNSIDDYSIGCHIRGLPVGSIRVAYVEWHRKCTCHVHEISRIGSILIRITMTLGYE
jgi:hypothetical protein